MDVVHEYDDTNYPPRVAEDRLVRPSLYEYVVDIVEAENRSACAQKLSNPWASYYVKFAYISTTQYGCAMIKVPIKMMLHFRDKNGLIFNHAITL